jgi:hypothetical protein
MRQSIILWFGLVFAFGAVIAPCQSPSTNTGGVLSEAALRKILTDTCDQVNAFYKAEHFPVPAPSPVGCSFSYDDDDFYKQRVGKFKRTYQTALDAELLAKSGTIITFSNWDVFHAAYGPKAPLYAQHLPAQWTQAHAIEVASKFADIFIKPWGSRLGKPIAFFNWPHGDYDPVTHTPKTCIGQWTVKWRRITPSGLSFDSDIVMVTLTEQYGPDGISIGFSSDYDDVPITPIAQDKALIEARKGLDKILGWGPAKSWLPNAEVRGQPKSELLIVQPNDLLAQKSFDDLAGSGQIKARLAWVVTYHVSSPTDPNINGNVSVYIDAHDGSFLGGTL